jgi:3-hydroxymyristoyl/3-hydroxydecanoyl-(acyl carrier protein) dehydratase
MRVARIEPEQISEQRSEERLVRALRVPKDLACWPGHFPGQEIVPGVVQLDWVLQAIADWTQRAPELVEIAELKFRALILPGQELTLELVREKPEHFRFALTAREGLLASGRVLLAAEPTP